MIFGGESVENFRKNHFSVKNHQKTSTTRGDKPTHDQKTPNLIFALFPKTTKNDEIVKSFFGLTAGGQTCHLFKSGFSKTKKSIFKKILYKPGKDIHGVSFSTRKHFLVQQSQKLVKVQRIWGNLQYSIDFATSAEKGAWPVPLGWTHPLAVSPPPPWNFAGFMGRGFPPPPTLPLSFG